VAIRVVFEVFSLFLQTKSTDFDILGLPVYLLLGPEQHSDLAFSADSVCKIWQSGEHDIYRYDEQCAIMMLLLTRSAWPIT